MSTWAPDHVQIRDAFAALAAKAIRVATANSAVTCAGNVIRVEFPTLTFHLTVSIARKRRPKS